MTDAAPAPPETIIEAGRPGLLYWHDLWRFRELFLIFAWRDIAVRYKQTVLGVAWAVVQPLSAMVVFTIVFGRFARLPADGVAYPLLVYAAMLPWQCFSNTFSAASQSLVANANLMQKVFFPCMLVPASTAVVALVDFSISFVIFVLLMLYWSMPFTPTMLLVPVLLLPALLLSVGLGLWFAALNVRYRDVRYVVPFVVQLGLFLSPVGFSVSAVPEAWRELYSLNPMVGVIDGFRWALLGIEGNFTLRAYVTSLLVSIAAMVLGIITFRRLERSLADVA